jgi:hypothetical protein
MSNKYAVVQNGIVTNIVMATEEVAAMHGFVFVPEFNPFDPDSSRAEIGGEWTGFRFLPRPRNIEAEWEKVRLVQNMLMSGSLEDVMPDRWETYTTTQKEAWIQYRNNLRDITTRFADPEDVVFPVKPQ